MRFVMGQMLNVITGATGLIGSHIAERLVQRGETVRALVRPSSDVSFLKTLGIAACVVDLNTPASVRAMVTGADTLYHCASRVGDFGAWKMFQTEVVDTTRNVLTACRAAAVARALHV